MIICPNCGRENQDHYKFCLGCGTELSKKPSIPVAEPVPTAIPQPVPVAIPVTEPTESLDGSSDDIASVDDIYETGSLTPTDPSLDGHEAAATATGGMLSVGGAAGGADVGETIEGGTAYGNRADIGGASAEAAEFGVTLGQQSDDTDRLSVSSMDEAMSIGDEASLDDPMGLGAISMMAGGDADTIPPMSDDLDVPSDPFASELDMHAYVEPAIARSTDPPSAGLYGSDAYSTDGSMDAISDGSLDGRPVGGGRPCTACGAEVPEGFKFCGVCGTKYDPPETPQAMPFVPVVGESGATFARLVVIRPDGSTGDVFPLTSPETTIGRSHSSLLFSQDPFLSPRHAVFSTRDGRVVVRDANSLNGIFVRARDEVELSHGDMFRIGQQLFRFEDFRQVRPILPSEGDGTTVMGSPVRATWGRLAAVVAIDTRSAVWTLRKPDETLGRERGDILFPEDGFVSGLHCRVSCRNGRFFLSDLGSSNGSYVRIRGEYVLEPDDLMLLGQQLFKLEYS